LTHVNILTYILDVNTLTYKTEIDMTVTGPDFLALQVRDLERAAAFYETQLGLRRVPAGPPGAVVFDTKPISFAVREPLPGVDLDAARPGLGVAMWLHAEDAQGLHDELAGAGVPIVATPVDGPFGRMFTFSDPDGYAITIHDKA
jgi:predicted enzyme related to lactoylglutathione lyase